MVKILSVLLLAFVTSGCWNRRAESPLADPRASLVQELRIDGHAHSLQPLSILPTAPAFFPDGRVAVASDGSIAILQAQTSEVLFFGDSGAFLGGFGREGAGPGEFRGITRIGWLADTLWIHDSALGRITLLSQSRTLVRTVSVSREARPAPPDVGRVPSAQYSIFLNPQPDGSVIRTVLVDDAPQTPDSFKDSNFFARVSPDGTIMQVLALVPRVGGARDASGFPVGPVHGVSADGRLLGFATATVDELGSPTYAVSIFAVSGDTVFSREYSPQGISAGGNSPLRGLIIGRDDTVWLQLPDLEDVRPHLVLDPFGDPIGIVDVPGRSRVAVAERGRIWITQRDDFDVESVVRYRVLW